MNIFLHSSECLNNVTLSDKRYYLLRLATHDGYQYHQVPITKSELDFLSEQVWEDAEIIYQDETFILAWDLSNFAPFCYTLYYKKPHTSSLDISPLDWLSAAYLKRELRKILREKFEISLVCIFGENFLGSNNAFITKIVSVDVNRIKHLGIPISNYQFHFAEYFNSYNAEQVESNAKCNATIRELLEEAGFRSRFQSFRKHLTNALDDTNKLPSNHPPQAEKKESLFEEYAFEDAIEVNSESDLPELPPDMRYFVSIGGSKEYQAFKAPRSWSRGAFMQRFSDKLDPVLEDLYNHKDVFIRQDASRALPGFYIIGPHRFSTSVDNTDLINFIRCMYVFKVVQDFNSSRKDVHATNFYYDENYGKPVHIHFWALPFTKQKVEQFRMSTRYDDVISWNYLESFGFQENKDKIKYLNEQLKIHFQTHNVWLTDNKIQSYITDFCQEFE